MSLPEVLASLESDSRVALALRWESCFGCPAPKSCQSPLLRGALAWHAQMQALRSSVGTRDANQASRALRSAAASPASKKLTPGTRLVREWRGLVHQVTVVPGGFELVGKTYSSLTAVAKEITGMAWSGPLFFGLRSSGT